WYHTHRHGEAEQETQMGLVGAIVIEDAGDAWRRSIGVTDEVLVIDDVPLPGGCDDQQCDVSTERTARLAARRAARLEAADTAAALPSTGPVLDPRIDQIDQAGFCSPGASGPAGIQGGTELWSLMLNGAPVSDPVKGAFPPDRALLLKAMRPGQRQIFRLVNAS